MRPKTTKILDVLDAMEILSTHRLWTVENCAPPPFENHDEQEHYIFFCNLGLTVYRDYSSSEIDADECEDGST